MKPERNVQLAAIAVVICSLLSGPLIWCRDSVTGSGWSLVLFLCYIVGAVGVIWLGWHFLMLAGAVTSIARQLNRGQSAKLPSVNSRISNQLCSAINSRINSGGDCKSSAEQQISDLNIAIQLAQRQKQNTEAIIYGIRDGVVVVDEYDRVLMANEAACELFNFDIGDCRNKAIGDLVDTDKAEFVDFLSQSRKSKVRHTKREMGFLIDDKPRTFSCVVSCVYDQKDTGAETGQVCGVVAVLHDITREKEISHMKNDFVSHVSHELKTPLASITAYSEMLLDGDADDEKTRQEFYEVIQSQAKRLNRLIEDILNTARIESGLIKMTKEPVSLTLLIKEQLQMIKGYAEEKNIKVSWGDTQQKTIVFDQVHADRDMIGQVIVNLLSNAVKYTKSGGSIKVKTEVDEIASLARVTVTDTGVGIPEDGIGHVFDKFYRVDANKQQAKGTGLGLNLVKQIIEEYHDGRVFVTSKAGQGSTFGFELPLATPEAVESQL